MNQNQGVGMNNNMQNMQQPMLNPVNQQAQLKNKIAEVESLICGEVIMVIFFSLFLGIDRNNKCMKPNWTSVAVFVAYLVIFRIPVNILKSYTLRTYKKESMAGLACGFLSKTFLTGWMIYSMTVYFGVKGDE